MIRGEALRTRLVAQATSVGRTESMPRLYWGDYLSKTDMQWMFERGDAVVYPEAKHGGGA